MSETNWLNGAAYAARLGAQAMDREAAQAAQKGAEVLCDLRDAIAMASRAHSDLAGSWDQLAGVLHQEKAAFARAKEELASAKQELASTKEELQQAKEELASSREELDRAKQALGRTS